jgi:anhydro-N-acetylmuramic acid kinase
LLRDKYYRAKPPKTAGREQFGAEFVSKLLDTELSTEDLIATATALTAESIASGIRNFVLPEMRVDEIFVSGGGTHNPTLMAAFTKAMDPIPVRRTSEVGLDVDAKEAIAFAVMAYETKHSRPSNVPQATGAKRSVVLGKITQNGPASANGKNNGSRAAESDSHAAAPPSHNVTSHNGSSPSHKPTPTRKSSTVARTASPSSKAKAAAR